MHRRLSTRGHESHSEKIAHPGPIANDPDFLNVAVGLHLFAFHVLVVPGEYRFTKRFFTGNHKRTSSDRRLSIVVRSPPSLAPSQVSTSLRIACSSSLVRSASVACLDCITLSSPRSMPANHFLRVAAAFFADREREAADRFLAALRAWRESARFEAALRPSRFSAREVARERLADFFVLLLFPSLRSRAACLRVFFDPFLGCFSFTPARLAFERPMAIACLVERAPCFPSRTCSISSRTNSPA